MESTDANGRAWSKGLTLTAVAAAIALLVGILFAYRAGRPDETSSAAASVTATPAATSAAAHTTGTDLTEAFRAFVMLDREREPAWLDRVDRVHWADNGQLWAETTYPADWTDDSDRTRPVQSICGQLSGYLIREVRRWTGVAVRAANGSELVARAREADSCLQ